jgi:hypothetical protein
MGVSAGRNRLVFLPFRGSSHAVNIAERHNEVKTESGERLIHAMNLAGLQSPRVFTITCD